MRLRYIGTVEGYRRYGRRALLKAAFMGQTIARDANRIQMALDKAAGQDRLMQLRALASGGARA